MHVVVQLLMPLKTARFEIWVMHTQSCNCYKIQKIYFMSALIRLMVGGASPLPAEETGTTTIVFVGVAPEAPVNKVTVVGVPLLVCTTWGCWWSPAACAWPAACVVNVRIGVLASVAIVCPLDVLLLAWLFMATWDVAMTLVTVLPCWFTIVSGLAKELALMGMVMGIVVVWDFPELDGVTAIEGLIIDMVAVVRGCVLLLEASLSLSRVPKPIILPRSINWNKSRIQESKSINYS